MAIDPSNLLLGVHVSAGAAGLAVGPLALFAPRRLGWQPALVAGYQVAVAALTTTALGLVALAPARLWWLVPFAICTEAAVIGGWWLGRVSIERSEPRSELTVGRASIERSAGAATPGRVRLMGGSYVSLITALLVVSGGGNVLTWVLPSVMGAVVVETAAARAGGPR